MRRGIKTDENKKKKRREIKKDYLSNKDDKNIFISMLDFVNKIISITFAIVGFCVFMTFAILGFYVLYYLIF